MSLIVNRPYPKISLILKNIFNKDLKFIDLLFFKRGREALIYGLKYIGLPKGSIVLVPAFICNSITEYLREYGYEVKYVDINHNLEYDLNIIQDIFIKEEISAIILVHYFGFIFDIEKLSKLCKDYDVKLVQDFCHSFNRFSIDKTITMFSDLCIYSLRKTLPISDGGALLINKTYDHPKITLSTKISIKQDITYLLFRFIEFVFLKLLSINLYSDRITFLKNKIRNTFHISGNKSSFATSIYPSSTISFLLSIFSAESYLSYTERIRINNYRYLSYKIKKIGLKPFFKELPSNFVPQFLILYDSDYKLSKWLRVNKIGAVRWPHPELPYEVLSKSKIYKNSIELDRKLVMLPLHQDLNYKSFDRLIYFLENWRNISEHI